MLWISLWKNVCVCFTVFPLLLFIVRIFLDEKNLEKMNKKKTSLVISFFRILEKEEERCYCWDCDRMCGMRGIISCVWWNVLSYADLIFRFFWVWVLCWWKCTLMEYARVYYCHCAIIEYDLVYIEYCIFWSYIIYEMKLS